MLSKTSTSTPTSIPITLTRFNIQTFKECEDWKSKNNYPITEAIYNSPLQIAVRLPINTNLFVLEMNNSTNKIEGFSLIKNRLVLDKKYKIYSDNNYNRFTYKGKIRIKRTVLNREEEKIMGILDTLLFTGSRHMKRGHGIQILPSWISNNRHINFSLFLHIIMKRLEET
jgi:hypothetical protein